MTTSVRLSDLHNSDNDLTSSKAGVNALRARFEKIGQSDDNIAVSSSTGGSNYRYSSSSVPRKPSTPPVRRSQGPARPPPPRTSEKPKQFSDQFLGEPKEPLNRSVTPTAGAPSCVSPQSPLSHPLSQSSRSRSVGDLKVVKQDVADEPANGSSAAVVEEEGGGTKKKGKKKNKGKVKEDNVNETSSGSISAKKFLNFKKAKSTDSPHASPNPSKNRKSSAPVISHSSPHSSPKRDPLPPTLESPSSTSSEAGSSKEGTPTAGRRKSSSGGGKKEAVKKTESSQGELSSGRENGKVDKKALRKSKSNFGATSVHVDKQERDMLGASPRHSPALGGRARRRGREGGDEADVKQEAKRIREAAIISAGKDLTAAKLEPVLKNELAYLTDGLEGGKHQVVVVMERSLTMIDSPTGFEDFKATLAYFRAIIKQESIDAGVTLVIDARDSKSHKPAKHLLERIETEDVPLPLHMIYIIIRTGFLGFRSKSLVSAESATKLHLAYISEPRQLVEQLGADNVVDELGGTLTYNHTTWISNRTHYERIAHLHKKTIGRLPETKKGLRTFKMPSTVKDAEQLMTEELGMKEKMINLFAESELKMDQFMASLNDQQSHAPASLDLKAMMASVGDMLMEIKDSQKEFDDFWKVHRSYSEHIMRMCHFSRSGEKLKQMMSGHIDDLAEDKAVLGDSLESALEQGEKHENFATKCLETIDEQMTKIKQDARELCDPNHLPNESEAEMHAAMQKAVEAVQTQLQELTKTYQSLSDVCQQKRDLYIVCVKFHMNLRQLQQWNDETMELLASQPLEEPSPSTALNLLSAIEQCQMAMTNTHVTNLTELASTLGAKTFKKRSDVVVKKYEHARNLLEQRKMFLQKILSAHFPRPVAPSSPQPLTQRKPGPDPSYNETDVHLEVPPDRRSLTSIVSTASSTDGGTSGGVPAGSGGEYQDMETDGGVLKNRQFVYKELVATEQDYIKDLSTVIDSYYDEMDPESVSIPLRLRGKREIVFGNLLEIKTFHETDFSKALEKYADCPERIGEYFTQHSAQFQMYSIYCKNRTHSETLINESTESQAFFKGIQLKLGHALHLNSYLLKPIQRITKYQLLLKDMMKHAALAKKAHSELQVALESMLKVLKNLNDSLHVLGVKGFPGSLAEQGRLLVHDPLQVSDNAGRFSRLRERHVFLFEKVIIVSKKVEAPVQHKKLKKSDAYVYKDHIQMALVHLRDTTDKHGLQFQITIHGQNKMYTFQASTKEVSDMWTAEIKRLLLAQFSLMKDMVLQSGTLDRSNYKGKARSGISRDSRLFGDSFKAPPRTPMAKRFLAGRLFRGNKKAGKRPETPKSGRKLAALEPSASLPAGLAHSARPTHSLTPYTVDSEAGEDKSDSISSDEEIAFSSDEEDGLATTAVDHYESLAPGAPRYYTATTDYNPGASDNGVQLTSGQEIEVIGINRYGWWWVRATNHYTNEVEEGWVPASYLQMSSDQTTPGPDSLMPGRLSALRSAGKRT